MHTLYSIQKLRKTRTKGDTTFTLAVDNFSVTAGEFCAVIGDSGCGKSTFLDILALVLRPSAAATFRIANDTASTFSDVLEMSEKELSVTRRKNLGYVLQAGGLLPFLTVKENILLTAHLNHCVDMKWFTELVTHLKLGDQLNKKPAHLSGGQRQRVAIGRALIHKPAVILADEPTAAVDGATAIKIRNTFVGLAKELKTAVVMVTHDHRLVEGVADSYLTFKLTSTDSGTLARTKKYSRR